jgi:hypothetical protein
MLVRNVPNIKHNPMKLPVKTSPESKTEKHQSPEHPTVRHRSRRRVTSYTGCNGEQNNDYSDSQRSGDYCLQVNHAVSPNISNGR